MLWKERLLTLFDETNDINENIVAMTFFICLLAILFIFFIIASCLSFLTILPACCFLFGMIVCLIGAFMFKAHEQGTLTGTDVVVATSKVLEGITEKKND